MKPFIGCRDLCHSAQYLVVLDRDIRKNRECGTKSVAFEQPQKLVPSPINSWISYLIEPSSTLNHDGMLLPCRALRSIR